MAVVLLERKGERDDVEVAERPPGLDGARLLARLVRKEGPLAEGARVVVQEAVDRVKAEVGHPEPVGVRVHEGDPELAARLLADRSALAGRTQVFQGPTSLRRARTGRTHKGAALVHAGGRAPRPTSGASRPAAPRVPRPRGGRASFTTSHRSRGARSHACRAERRGVLDRAFFTLAGASMRAPSVTLLVALAASAALVACAGRASGGAAPPGAASAGQPPRP